MKLKFKVQAYQTHAVESVIGCFKGQPNSVGISYRIDQGVARANAQGYMQQRISEEHGFKNGEIKLSEYQVLENIQEVQRQQNLPQSTSLVKTSVSNLNLDVEMETGTGKTYCYIKTIFEMNMLYGWTKYIIVVPSIAIREVVYKSLEITAEHFQETYNKKARYFIYNSKQLYNLESFSSDAGINIMVINVQAFNARSEHARRIYEELDNFQSRRPIDVIKENRPILILDEPQKMEGSSTLKSLMNFNPLFILRYSATHKTQHNKIHRLDALDAYNQKLVKKIAVRGISTKGFTGANTYLYLESIEVSKQAPIARIEFEVKQDSGIKRIVRKLKKGDSLYKMSAGLNQYKNLIITDINAVTDTVEFINGHQMQTGDVTGDVNETTLRRIQIREAIKAHFEKEQVLFRQGIKVLTLFFIDQVDKYRRYTVAGEEGGEYARIFEEEYNNALNELKQDGAMSEGYKMYLDDIPVNQTHNGYFSIDKRSKRMIDSVTGKKSTETDDVDAYDLILKDKERLLSVDEPTRFIFSHSALREGWDNPNVFVICTLKRSDNTISRRQEVGRGLRIAVNQQGERQDNLSTVHQTNVLTVIANESYKEFVAALQKDISESLSDRPRVADVEYFTGKIMQTSSGTIEVTKDMATGIEFYLIQNGYIDREKFITQEYHDALKNEELVDLPEDLQPYTEQVFQLIDSIYSDVKLPQIENDRAAKTNSLNANFQKKEFQKLWNMINHKAAYSVHFDSAELVEKCVQTLNNELRVNSLQYTVQWGEQTDGISFEQMASGESFVAKGTATKTNIKTVLSSVKYDLIGKVAENTQLTRKTVAEILSRIEVSKFTQFKSNPENFISEVTRLIREQKATVVIEHLSYDAVAEKHDIEIFTEGQCKQDFSRAGGPLNRHIYDYVITDSKIESTFVQELDASSEVVVYAKLPKGFSIPTPVGNYNPDWAISFEENSVKHVYFVAETKGSMSSMDLRKIENTKIECARRFFDEINKIHPDNVKYEVVNTFRKLLEIVGTETASHSG